MIIPMSPRRRVQNNTIHSNAMPSITIEVDSSLQFISEMKFTRMEVCAIQLFLFAEVDGKNIKRLLTLQFETYLPGNSYSFEYPRLTTDVQIGNKNYLTDGGILKLDAVLKKTGEGDIAYWVEWLKRDGYDYQQWKELAYSRFVRVLDKSARTEFLIVYFENLQQHGFHADDLLKDGQHKDKLPQLKQVVHQNALDAITVVKG